MSLYRSIQENMSKKNINTITGDIYDFIAIWKEWYRGNVNDFHNYSIKLASGKTKKCEKLTMNMPKKVCEDFSKLLWSEKVKIELDSEDKTKKLWAILDNKKNNFSVNIPGTIEKAFALGTSSTIEYKVNDEVRIEYIDADVIMPYEYTNGYISGMITISTFTKGLKDKRKYYTHLTFHEFNGKEYKKYNELYVSKESSELGKEIPFEEMFPTVTNPLIEITDTPHFQIIKPNIVNNLDLTTPMGISVLANNIDKFKSIDDKYDSFRNEFKLGKKRILVDKSAIKKSAEYDVDTEETRYVSYFDENDTVYQAIGGMEQEPAKEIDFTLRHTEHIESINAELNYLSAGTGLGQNYYSFDGQGVKTATEVVSENSDTYRTKQNHQIIIKDAIYDLVKSVMFLAGIKSEEIMIAFDDSIIQDESTIKKEGREKVSVGVLSKKTYLIKYENMTETEANEELQRINEENKVIMPEGVDFFGTDKKEEK